MPGAVSDQESRIFEPIAVGRKLLRIRVIVPGDHLGLDEDGVTGEHFIVCHREIVRAGVGIRIAEDVKNAAAVDWDLPDHRVAVRTATAALD
jgi:hypothetical protein